MGSFVREGLCAEVVFGLRDLTICKGLWDCTSVEELYEQIAFA
jgi:hypothetical protein